MILSSLIFVFLTVTASVIPIAEASPLNKPRTNYYALLLAQAKELLSIIDHEYGQIQNQMTLAAWNYETTLTEKSRQMKIHASALYAYYWRQWAAAINYFPWRKIQDYNLKRQFEMLLTVAESALPNPESSEHNEILMRMQKMYATTDICDLENPSNCTSTSRTELTNVLRTSRNPDELKYVWKAWRDARGKKVRKDFIRYVELSNKIVRLNGYSDQAAFWMKDYQADDFNEQIEDLWQQIKPLYLQIHAYMRHALRLQYGETVVPKDGPIPAHLLGNMLAQSWIKIADIATPYPDKKPLDVTDAMIQQGYNTTQIFRIAEDFFTSVNLSAMPNSFWKNSILEKPKNVELVCQASAWDFYDGHDFRIKQCTNISMQDLLTAHHEMGHIQYFLQYKNQPTVFKGGANPGFHEAVGDTIALSAFTLDNFKRIGLLEDASTDEEAVINHLYINGLQKIVFLPFAYMLEKWRWGVFKSRILPDNYNCQWWNLAEEYQGIVPPVPRNEEDFDPGSVFHVIADVEYIRYFVSFVIQFQFHKALCIEAGQYNPEDPTEKLLSECNIYGNAKAGNLLRSMLELGSSLPWQDAMEKITGQRNMDASGLLEYFKPLQVWLEAENRKNGESIGWTSGNNVCTKEH